MRSRLNLKFQQQVGYLQRSIQLFDQGHEDEAIRLAVSLRVFLHNKHSSKSLFRHIGLTNPNLLSSGRGHENWQDYLAMILDVTSSQPVKAKAILGESFREMTCKTWWEEQTVFEYNSIKYTRKDVCLNAANKDGGAHVDEKFEQFYEALQAGITMLGTKGDLQFINGNVPFPQGVFIQPQNGHYCLIRQFAHEFFYSVTHFKYM